MLSKKKIRKNMLKQRKELSPSEVSANSLRITQRLLLLDVVKKSNCFHLYFPINNEVDTTELIKYLWKHNKTVIMPRTDFENKTLKNSIITSFDQLEETTFSMMEPKAYLDSFTGHIDIVLVPGVAFDRSTNRMGYGGGFYDRFLNTTSAIKIALSHHFQLMDSIPSEEHDVRMDYIITEEEIIDKEQL